MQELFVLIVKLKGLVDIFWIDFVPKWYDSYRVARDFLLKLKEKDSLYSSMRASSLQNI